MDEKRALLRHTVATVAYRGGKAVRGAPASFAQYSPDGSPRTAARILAHIGDLFDWGLSIAKGNERWRDSKPLHSCRTGAARAGRVQSEIHQYSANRSPAGAANACRARAGIPPARRDRSG